LERIMKGMKLIYLLLACFAAGPALAQASASVAAGNLNGTANAGPAPLDRRAAEGPRTDDTRNCNERGVTVHFGNGSSSASASVSTPPGGASAVAGGGSPGSHTEYFGCKTDNNRSVR
jgi:hypothetical protein